MAETCAGANWMRPLGRLAADNGPEPGTGADAEL